MEADPSYLCISKMQNSKINRCEKALLQLTKPNMYSLA